MSTFGHSSWLRMAECDLGRRARSAPSRPACSAKSLPHLLAEWSEPPHQKRRSPLSPTRERLSRLSTQELCGVIRNYGMPKLCCAEDRRLVDALIPLPSPHSARPQQSFNYLAQLNWQELVGLVRRFARKQADGDDGEVAAYLDWICETLQKGHLRNQVQRDAQDCILSWRMRHCCTRLGISDEWEELDRRLDRSELVIATSGKSMLVRDEIRQLFQLVPAVQVVPFDKLADGTRSLESAALLYVTGHHSGEGISLNQLDVSGIWLIFLNMCLTETLARQLLSRGALNVVYWPSVVPDVVAVDFGICMVAALSTCNIKEAVSHATSKLRDCMHHPVLISQSCTLVNESVVIDKNDTESLRSIACSHCGAQCQFTVESDSTGVVDLACCTCTKAFQIWPCRRCDRVFFKHQSFAAHMAWHTSPPQTRQAQVDAQHKIVPSGLPPGGWKSETRYYKSGANVGQPYVRYQSPGGHLYHSKAAAWRVWESRHKQAKVQQA